MAQKVNDYKRGQGAKWRDGIWIFQSMDHVKPGKGPAYIQAELKNVMTGQLVANRFRPEEQLEPVHFDRKKMQYLYSDGSNHVFMDTETYEQAELARKILGDRDVYLAENIECEVCYCEGALVSVELPNTVELTVEDTPPQVKGATATNQPKEATCQGGAKIKVPPFVENGTAIKVDTRTGEYLGRA